MSRAFPALKPREAASIARRLGWEVGPKARTGELLFVAPDGRRFVSQGHGRTDSVPLVLSKALHEAQEATHA